MVQIELSSSRAAGEFKASGNRFGGGQLDPATQGMIATNVLGFRLASQLFVIGRRPLIANTVHWLIKELRTAVKACGLSRPLSLASTIAVEYGRHSRSESDDHYGTCKRVRISATLCSQRKLILISNSTHPVVYGPSEPKALTTETSYRIEHGRNGKFGAYLSHCSASDC